MGGVGALLAQRLASWRAALRSVYLALRLGQCPAFYLVMQVCVGGMCWGGGEGGQCPAFYLVMQVRWCAGGKGGGGGGVRSGSQDRCTGPWKCVGVGVNVGVNVGVGG